MATACIEFPPPPAARRDLESLLVANLVVVQRIVGALGRRQALSHDAAEEFGAWAVVKLIESDYAILGKFRGESSLPTYLAVVLATLYREYRTTEWGRWRTSAAARREGNLAVRLETLIVRDGWTLAEAGQALRMSGVTSMSDPQLSHIASGFPRRTPMRPVEARDFPGDAVAPDAADDLVDAEECAHESEAARRALNAALATLGAEERCIVHMHVVDGLSVAEIARGLALPQKPLYRRVARALSALRAQLVSRDAAQRTPARTRRTLNSEQTGIRRTAALYHTPVAATRR